MKAGAVAVTLVALGAILIQPSAGQEPPVVSIGDQSPLARARAEQQRAADELFALEHQHLRWPEERSFFVDAARAAWSLVEQQYQPTTGLVRPLPDFGFATVWDVGSMLAAFYSAHALGFIDTNTYVRRVDRLLTTLASIDLYEGRVFNKWYNARTGGLVRRGRGEAEQPGWSATDLGRLLIWLKIVGTDERFAQRAEAIVRRNDFSGVVRNGYLWGEDVDAQGRARVYQEGRIGYEQYAARGMELWGHRAEKAIRLTENALPITVMDQPLLADYRRWDRLTSEPFLLWGMELGWDAETTTLVRALLRAQEGRYRKTGRLTIVGEDSIPQPPDYFYYYCAYTNGKEFSIDVQDRQAVADGPRWVSAKSAFAFHALMPTTYTQAAVRALAPARARTGWASGVYEHTGASTGALNINTAGVILTAALVQRDGLPLLAHAQRASRE